MSAHDEDRRERRAVRAVIVASLAVIAVAALPAFTSASRALPADGVIETVPPRATDPLLAEIARRSRALPAGSADTRLARLAIEASRRRGDPRYLGQAEAALGPAWLSPDAADESLLLRATLKQARHDFDGALADLDRLIARVPGDPQAQLTRAVVLTVKGRYREALASCDALAGRVRTLYIRTCRAPALAATGGDGAGELERALDGQGPDPWAQSVLGELRLWQGDASAAERHLRLALAVDPTDRYTRGLLADLLLDGGRFDEVATLLGGEAVLDDASLLRLAVAERRRGGPRAALWAAELRERFAAARRRGDGVHSREQSRFALEIESDPAAALDLALESWRVQREPWDARLVLAAARRVGAVPAARRSAVQEVTAFVAERGSAWAAACAGGRP